MANRKKTIGLRFGRLIVLSDTGNRDKKGQIFWECQCDCGNKHIAIGPNLRNGNIRSCGCLAKEESSKRAKARKVAPKICIHKNCKNTTEGGAWGFCGKHYMRVKRYGDPDYITPEEKRAMKQRLSLQQNKPAKENTYRKFYGRHEHRVIGEKIANRSLKEDEHVHHKDENKHNNSEENLEIMTAEEHAKYHAKTKILSKKRDR